MISLDTFRQQGIVLDLAVEAHELLRGATRQEIPGVKETKETYDHAQVTLVNIFTVEGEQAMGKPQGNYITIEAPAIRRPSRETHEEISAVIANQLQKLLQSLAIGDQDGILVIGLGNWDATPDALGPRVIERTLVTRHLQRYASPAIFGGLRPVAAMAPGVLGTTGIETAEVVRGVVNHIQPAAVIAVDALAARSVHRITSTIQLADTGINPGSGVGNHRNRLNRETLGVPVIAVGVPTVVNAAVIAYETLDQLWQAQPQLYKEVRDHTIQNAVKQVLAPFEGNLTVTPKEIDNLIKNTAALLATALNQVLNPTVDPADFGIYLH